MMNVQAAEAYPIYQCYVCYLDRENFAVKDFKTGPKLISHMRTVHAFVLEKGDAARPDTIIALPQHAAVKAAQPQTARPEPPQRIALSQAHQEQQAPDLTDEEVIEETTRRGWHSDDIGLGQSRQAWLDYARHGNPAFIRRRPDWSLWVVELYIRNNHPDDDINPDFIEDLEDVDQD